VKRRSGSEEMSSARCTHARAHRTHTLHGCRQRSKHRCLHTAVVCTAGRGRSRRGAATCRLRPPALCGCNGKIEAKVPQRVGVSDPVAP